MQKKLILAAAAAAAIAAFSSCNGTPEFIGQWVSDEDIQIQNELPSAVRATTQYTFDFSAAPGSNMTGPVSFSSTIEIIQMVDNDTTVQAPYQVNVSAATSVTGNWNYTEAGDDDLVLTFDMSSLSVEVDPDGVTFSENLLTGAQQPVIDSLTAVTAERWKTEITAALQNRLASFAHIDDVDVENDGNKLTFEVKVNGQKDKYTFRRVIVAE